MLARVETGEIVVGQHRTEAVRIHAVPVVPVAVPAMQAVVARQAECALDAEEVGVRNAGQELAAVDLHGLDPRQVQQQHFAVVVPVQPEHAMRIVMGPGCEARKVRAEPGQRFGTECIHARYSVTEVRPEPVLEPEATRPRIIRTLRQPSHQRHPRRHHGRRPR